MSNKMDTSNNPLPKLRFPEFQDAPEWSNKKLEEISVPVVERVGDKKLTPVSISAGIGFVPQIEKFGRDISGNQYRLYTLVRDGDFVYNKGNSIKFPQGCVYILRNWGEVAAPNVFICFRLKDGYVNDFYQYCFEKNMHGLQLKKHITSGARSNGLLNISKDTFFGISIPTPSTVEQQKIADCLTSLDELITAQSQKVEALQAYKKGLMQNLFPAEGESVPRLRFPEFESAGEWEVVALSKVYSFKVTNSFSRDQLNYTNGSVKNIHYGDIHTKFSTLFDIRKETVPYISPSQPIEKIKLESYCVEGDIIFADASEDLNDVGKSIEIVNLNNEKLVSGLHTLLARQITPKLVVGFGGHLFKSDRIRAQIKKEAQGAKVLGISSGRLSNIEIYFPSDKKEQQRIAELLSAIDEQISAQSEAVEMLKSHKKGLMQGLFPSVGGDGAGGGAG